MFRYLIVALIAVLSVAVLSDAADELHWQVFSFGKTTPDEVVLLFGPPATIKTEERYSDWVKSQASGCGQLRTYAMNYSIWAGDLNILKGPLGKASEAYVVINNGRVSEVVWTYDNNQLEPALHQWLNHKGLTPMVGTKERSGGSCRLLQWRRGCRMPRSNFGALLGGYRQERLITRHPSRPGRMSVWFSALPPSVG
jgi:hypothetical protein